jgi:pimeloyl-ACP methyl ester carboxylesterase
MTVVNLRRDAGAVDPGAARIRAAEGLVYDHHGMDPRERYHRVETGCGHAEVRVTELAPDAPGVPVVVLHGIGSATVLAAALLGHLRHRRVLAVDWPGHGLSGPCVLPPTLPIRTHAVTTLASLLDTLGLPEVDLVGHSLGAQFSLYAAHDLGPRVRRVVLLGAPGAAIAGVRPVPAMKLLAIPGLGRAALSMKMSERTFARTQDQVLGAGVFDDSPADLPAALYALAGRTTNAASIASFFRALIKGGGVRAGVALSHEELGRLRQPVLFVWGDQDVFLAPSAGAAAIVACRDVRLLRLPTAGHAPWLHALRVVGPAVADHLWDGR